MDKSLSIDTGHHEKLYQERMNFLLTGEKDRVCSIYIDVTDDKMLALITRKHKYNDNELNNISVKCWLDKYIYPNISDGYNLEEFCWKTLKKVNVIYNFIIVIMVKMAI